MEFTFFAAMMALLAYVLYRNIVLVTRYRHNKEYIECYKLMLDNDDTALSRIDKYIEAETSEEFKNKGRVLKIYQQLNVGEDAVPAMNELNLKEIFMKNGNITKNQLSLNIDIFVWLYLDLAKARRLSKFDVLNGLHDKINELELDNRIEFQLANSIYNALCEKEDAGVEFFTSMLEGTYKQYDYEKNLIGLYKRFSSSTLAYSGEPMDDFYKEDLHAFAKTAIGKVYMTDLEIYDKYPPIEDKTEEVTEENKEEKE